MTEITGTRHFRKQELSVREEEFIEITRDILEHPEFLKLKNYRHHLYQTRYQHCLNVAWYTYVTCKRAGLNYVSAARGALLHDFYLYDHNNDEAPMEGSHFAVHPQVALMTAEKYFVVDPVMKDCILYHMWPSTPKRPRTREGFIVTLADKYAASVEVGSVPYRRLKALLKGSPA